MYKVPLIEGNQNSSSIPTGTNTLALTITHSAGSDFIIEGFDLQYNASAVANIDEVQIRLYDAQRNRDIITPNTPIGMVGARRTVSKIVPFQKLHDPIVLVSGQSIQLYVNNQTGSSIAARDISLALYGYQVVG
jgi:hypothetical protein